MKGDCLQRMKELPDHSVDMILCDLPYGVTANELDIVIPFDLLWEQYNRLTKDNSAILLFGQGIFYIDLVDSNRKMFKYDLVWDKVLTSGFLNANRMPLRRHEQIAVFYNNQPVYNPQMVKGKPNHNVGDITREKTNNNYGDFERVNPSYDGMKYPTSIISYEKPHPSISQHRTEKSVPMLEYLIKTYTDKGMVVLDNCMGSGTTGLACINTERNFIGIEKDENYFKISCDRIRDNLPLFRKRDLEIV